MTHTPLFYPSFLLLNDPSLYTLTGEYKFTHIKHCQWMQGIDYLLLPYRRKKNNALKRGNHLPIYLQLYFILQT